MMSDAVKRTGGRKLSLRQARKSMAIIIMATTVSACGLRTPEVVLGDDPNAASFFVNSVVNHVRCELRYAVRYAVWYDTQNAREQPDHKRRIPWIDKWGA